MDVNQVYTALDDVIGLEISTVSENAAVEMHGSGKMYLRDQGQDYLLRGRSRNAMLKHLGVSNGLLKKLTNTTSTSLLTELCQRQGEFSLLRNASDLVGFAPKGRYKNVPVEKVIETISTTLGAAMTNYHRALVLPNYDVRVEVLGPNESAVKSNLKKDDLVKAGACVQFNPVGLTNPSVQTYGLRLICLNGQTATEVLQTYELGLDSTGSLDTLLEWMSNNVRKAYESLPAAVEKWNTLAADTITEKERPLLLAAVSKDAKLKGAVAEAFWAQATQEPPNTAYDVYNLITWASSNVMEDPQQIVLAQDVAAKFANDMVHKKYCPTCQRVAQ